MTEMVNVKIDGEPLEVPKGTLIIRAAEAAGVHIPRFCEHPLLEPVAACRQCLVEVAMPGRDGNISKMPKPQPACAMTCTPGMEVYTQFTSEVADVAQKGIMEFLLINHPLDCPVCDKGGECPLQNQAMSDGRATSRFTDVKRTYPKPVSLSTAIMLDRDRCILCQRCTRFSKQIAGDPFIALQMRGGGSSPLEEHGHQGAQVGAFDTQVLGFVDEGVNPHGHTYTDQPGTAGPGGQAGIVGSAHPGPIGPAETDTTGRAFASYFSGNVIQICPVGALTSASYRFRGRPFDLVSTNTITEHDASGSALRYDVRRGVVLRRMASRDMEVNEEWITDKDRFAYAWQFGKDRLSVPLVRNSEGTLVPTSWSDALYRAAQGLREARENRGVGFLPGGRLTFEDAYAWSKFARVVGTTNDIDMRARIGSAEEASFLGSEVAGQGLDVTYNMIEKAGQVLLVGFEPEDECGTVFLRLRKGVLAGSVKVATVAPFTSRGSAKLSAQVISAAPGTEVEVLENLPSELLEALGEPGAVIMVGERACRTAGALSAVVALAEKTGARLAWVPRRAGERGGVEAGLLPNLLPFGRDLADAESRADTAAVWDCELPAEPGRDLPGIIRAAGEGGLSALVVGGVDLRDLPDPVAARAALKKVDFLVSLEVRASEVSELADVVLPVAPHAEKPGTYINWEGRLRPFGQALSSRAMSDREVLNKLAEIAEVPLGLATMRELHTEANELMEWRGARTIFQKSSAAALAAPAENQAVLATHKPMLDAGRLQDFEEHLAGTARTPVVRLNQATAESLSLVDGQQVRVSGPAGSITLPLVISDLPERVVWLPECSTGSTVHQTLGVTAGAVVSVEGEVK